MLKMKTHKNLYPQIYDFANLMLAWRKARRGKRYTPAAAAFERELDITKLACLWLLERFGGK